MVRSHTDASRARDVDGLSMISLKNWFRPGPHSRDGLTQSEREAIVDLLNYCSLVDHDIAHSEEVAIDELEWQLDWDHRTDFDYYVNQSVGLVRRAIESKDDPFFLQQIRKRLESQKSRETAVELCEKLIRSDGRISAEENAALAAIKDVLLGAKD
jgi:hypothetical protein